jgi:hypothetical protein
MCGGGRGEGADSVLSPPKTQGKGGVGASMRLVRVKECYLNIKSRHNFGIKYIHIL